MKRILLTWGPVVLVCAMIFILSADTHSGQHSQALLGWILGWFHARNHARMSAFGEPFRKLGHVVVYSLLAISSWRALSFWKQRKRLRWMPPFLWTLLLLVLYAASDEWHQTFVPTRSGSVRDVVVDTLGGLLGLGLYLCWRQWVWPSRRTESCDHEYEFSAME